jgi:hypothetical protein
MWTSFSQLIIYYYVDIKNARLIKVELHLLVGRALYQGPTTYGNATASPSHSQPALAGYQPSPNNNNNNNMNGRPQVLFSSSNSNAAQPQVAFAQAPASSPTHQDQHHRYVTMCWMWYDVAIAPGTPNGTQLSCPQVHTSIEIITIHTHTHPRTSTPQMSLIV